MRPGAHLFYQGEAVEVAKLGAGWSSTIDAANTFAEAEAACRQLVQSLGFSYFELNLRVALSRSGPAQFVLSGYPEEWLTRYQARGYTAIDPIPTQALARMRPFNWTDLDLSSPAVAAFFQDAAEHGLYCGVTVPVRGLLGSFSLLSLARPDPLQEGSYCLDRLYRHAHWLALRLHERLCRLICQEAGVKEPGPRLSPRERQCLSLAAQGHTARAIGRKLRITERTAVFHLNHAMEKLGARSRQHAIAVGASLNLLDLNEQPRQLA